MTFNPRGSVATVRRVDTDNRPNPQVQIANNTRLLDLVSEHAKKFRLAITIPVTHRDLGSESLEHTLALVKELAIYSQVVIVLNATKGELETDPPSPEHFKRAQALAASVPNGIAMCLDSAPFLHLDKRLADSCGPAVHETGKGRAYWRAAGYLISNNLCDAMLTFDADAKHWDKIGLAMLSLPAMHPSIRSQFVKASYLRSDGRHLYGRVVRLFVEPLLAAMEIVFDSAHNRDFIRFLQQWSYFCSGEFIVSSDVLLRCEIPTGFQLETAMLINMFKNLGRRTMTDVNCLGSRAYDHAHSVMSAERPNEGLMNMAQRIANYLLQTMSARGEEISLGKIDSLRATYLDQASTARASHLATAICNGLRFDPEEGSIVEKLAAGLKFDPAERVSVLPKWQDILYQDEGIGAAFSEALSTSF